MKRFLAINPNNHVVWHNKGLAHTLLLDKKTAIQCYKRALEIKPDYAMAKDKLKFFEKTTKADMEYIAKDYKSRMIKEKRKAEQNTESGKVENSEHNCIYQIKITLKNIKPAIWRRILVKADINLFTLHVILQEVMGWEGGHLHQFLINGEYYGQPDPEFDISEETINEKTVKLKDVVNKEKQKFHYDYDFGDDWRHELIIEKILPLGKGRYYPVCIDGARACPPEDCGGIPGYEDFLTAIKRPNHAEHEAVLEWIGGSFDPEEFDMEEINEALKDIKNIEKMYDI